MNCTFRRCARTGCLSRCAIEEFKRSSDSWRSHAKTTAALRSEFAELLGDVETPAQPDQAARPAHGPQQDASGVPALQIPAGLKEDAQAPKLKKAKKEVPSQPLQHDVGALQRDKSVTPAVHLLGEPSAVGRSGKPKKRRKDARASALGSASADAEMGVEHANGAAIGEQNIPEASLPGHAAAEREAKNGHGSSSKKRKVKRSTGSSSEGAMPVAAGERTVGKVEEHKVAPVAPPSETTKDRREQTGRQLPSAQQAEKADATGKKKKVKKQRPDGL